MSTKIWLITGASSGFGRTLAEAVLARGDSVALGVRAPEKVADLIAQFPETAAAFALDLTAPASLAAAPAQVVARFGRLDVLVNNAGYGLLAALEETTDDQLQRNLTTNLVGPLQLIRATLPIMRTQKSGQIVNLSAIAAFANEMGYAIYGGAKAALEAASEALASEVRPLGIKVTLVIPGPFRTDFIGRSLEAAPRLPEYAGTVGKFAAFLQRIDGKQPGDPARAAQAICAAVDQEKPPFRLLLGAYAHDRFGKKIAQLAGELEASKPLGLATDFAA